MRAYSKDDSTIFISIGRKGGDLFTIQSSLTNELNKSMIAGKTCENNKT